MLAELTIENLGVIPTSSVELSPGLTVLTGETGAGKTMVVSGLRLLSGARADASRVRTGAKQAAVEGRFAVDELAPETSERIAALVEEAGGAADENDEFIASRVVSANGRSKAHLGGRSVPAATLQSFAQELLTIHGQNDQLRLLSPDRQLEALDRFEPRISNLLANYKEAFNHWRKLAKDLSERTEKRRELSQEVDRLQFALQEIDAVAPVQGEDMELQQLIRRLQDVDSLREAASGALVAIDGGEFGSDDASSASDLLGQAEGFLSNSEDDALKELGSRLSDLTSALSDISMELGSYLGDLPSDPEALDSYLSRQQDLKTLTRKYAPDIEGVLEWREKAARRLDSIDVSSDALEQLKKQVEASERHMRQAAKKLSAARQKAAAKLAEQVTEELQGLAMAKARFVIDMSFTDPTKSGVDTIEFQLSPNEEATPRALATSASGGELSRVMLALEVILSAGTTGTTLVFDEVDAGVGGRAAVEIGRRLARLAQKNQVLVVTHLPQVAAYADTHLHVSKNVGDSSVTSGVDSLEGDARVEELARMLAGLDNTETGRAHAAELLETAAKECAAMRKQKMSKSPRA